MTPTIKMRAGITIGCVASWVAAMLAFSATPAGAAITVGETFVPTTGGSGGTFLGGPGLPPPQPQWAAPAAGVLTSWSFQGGSSVPTQMTFKVARPAPGGTVYTVLGEGSPVVPTADTLNTYPIRIPIAAGDVIGYSTVGASMVARPLGGYSFLQSNGDVAPGASATFGTTSGFQLDLSANLELDADNDGFGDESQDQCPSNAAFQAPPCDGTAPETTITKKPKKKTTKKKAKFEFASTEASSFTCQLDKKRAAPCTSPKTYKVKVGKHTFSVFATNAAANNDATPATYKWRRKARE